MRKDEKKWASQGKNEDVPSKNRRQSDPKRGKTRKSGLRGAKKRARSLEKSPENGPKTRKDEKKMGFTGQKTRAIPRKSAGD